VGGRVAPGKDHDLGRDIRSQRSCETLTLTICIETHLALYHDHTKFTHIDNAEPIIAMFSFNIFLDLGEVASHNFTAGGAGYSWGNVLKFMIFHMLLFDISSSQMISEISI
jgi:hypothetical protein